MHTVEVDELGVGSRDESSRSSKSSSFEGFGFLLDPMIFSAAAIVSWRKHGLNEMGKVGVVLMRNFFPTSVFGVGIFSLFLRTVESTVEEVLSPV